MQTHTFQQRLDDVLPQHVHECVCVVQHALPAGLEQARGVRHILGQQ
jgi:hypothetical protein